MGKFNQQKADVLTLGYELSKILNRSNCTNKDYEQLGRDFVAIVKLTSSDELHRAVKHIRMGDSIYYSMLLKDFILKYSAADNVVTNPIYFTNGGAKCSVRFFKNARLLEHNKYPYYITDFAPYCDVFAVVDGLESVCEGAGKCLIQSIVANLNIPILIQAGFLHYGDYEVESIDNCDSGILEKLCKYYESLGFVVVNDIVGNYEDSIIMLHDKDIETRFKPKHNP